VDALRNKRECLETMERARCNGAEPRKKLWNKKIILLHEEAGVTSMERW
jgi:hypothetical protein